MILVLGATGNVGGEVAKRLTLAGVKYRAAFHSAEKAAKSRLGGLEPIVVDLAKRETLRPALEGVEKLFLGTPAGPQLPEYEGNVIEEAKQAGVKHVVKLSALNAPAKGYTYARWHRAAEEQLEASGMAYTHLRASLFMQNLVNSFAGSIRAQGAFQLPAGEARVSQVDVRDVGGAVARVLRDKGHEGKAYELTGPEALTFAECAAKLSAVLGKPVTFTDVEPEEFKLALTGHGMPEWSADAFIDLLTYCKTGGGALVTTHVEQVGKRSPTSFERFSQDYVTAFR